VDGIGRFFRFFTPLPPETGDAGPLSVCLDPLEAISIYPLEGGNTSVFCASERNGAFQPRQLASRLHLMGQISAASPDWYTDTIHHPRPSASHSSQPNLPLSCVAAQSFERAGGREVKQMGSAYSACLLVSW